MIEIDTAPSGKLYLNPAHIVAIESNGPNRCIISTVGGKVFHLGCTAKEVSLALAGYPIRKPKEQEHV